jgi:hypothetical protein
MSGIFRDSFQNVVELLDDCFQRAAAADEPPERNFIRRVPLLATPPPIFAALTVCYCLLGTVPASAGDTGFPCSTSTAANDRCWGWLLPGATIPPVRAPAGQQGS